MPSRIGWPRPPGVGIATRLFVSLLDFGTPLLFAASLALPTIGTLGPSIYHPGCEIAPGFLLLVTGPLGVLVFQFGWFANVFSILAYLSRRWSVALAIIGVAFSVDAFFVKDIPNDNGSNPVCAFGSGFYCWQLCTLLVLARAVLRRHLLRREREALRRSNV